MKKLIISAAVVGALVVPAVASADQPLCPQSTGAANADQAALTTGNAPLVCAI